MANGRQVLVVEDNYLLLEMLTTLCEREGAQVVAASSGEAALALIREKGAKLDWLLTDINLPGLIDGWTVADAYRTVNPDRPVIYASTAGRIDRRSVPGSIFLRKPFRMHDVVAIARMMMGAAAVSPLRAVG
ncbi:response regulator [Methylobacterium sp. BTF04]|uniref:response regulator n=1 Tax=Methylobacterium sp. BTF04 TaxID=2708300 RepID=UPI0013D27C4C|nr:response regulator [Methylobacterium sp. BTF04]NEU11471.1 response regulator [Methylobacterium sp. BTF04]